MLDFSSKYRVGSRRKGDVELHEVFLDRLAKRREEELGISEIKLEVPLSEKIAFALFSIFVLLIVAFFAKTFYFQTIKGAYFSGLSDDNKGRINLVRPERGVIYDKNLNQLVSNAPAFDLVCDKRDLFSSPFEGARKIRELAKITGQDPEVLKKQVSELETTKVLVGDNLPHQTLVLLETKINEFPGCQIEKNTIRDYNPSFPLSHLLGFTGKVNKAELKEARDYSVSDYIGKTGVERSYEAILRGKPGKIETEQDARGNKKSEKILAEPEPGKSLVLFLDANLQQKLAEELEKSVQRIGAAKGAAVAMDPKTGGILAMVSWPDFDNNLLSKGGPLKELKKLQEDIRSPFLNRALSAGYAPGSTIKPLLASAGLQEGIINSEEIVNCQGLLAIPNPYYPDSGPEYYTYKDWKTHGLVSLREAIAESCNVYFYRLGGGYKDFKGLGVEKIKEYLTLFNWGQITGIDLPYEEIGLLPKPEEKYWRVGDTYHFSIGQGDILITPLQVVAAFSAIANGGNLFQPKVVKKIITGPISSPLAVKEIKPKIIRENFIDPANLKIVREGMREAVIYGSSAMLNYLPIKAAAKTGTAQTPKDDYYHHWVTVFAPYENPQIVLTIMVEEVKGLQSATLPVAKETLEWYFSK